MSITLEQAIEQFGIDVEEHHQRELEIPVLDGDQAQGDVMVLVAGTTRVYDAEHQVPPTGVAVVRGENGGNTHTLLADGQVAWFANEDNDGRSARTAQDLVLGHFVVADGAIGYLAHPEHAYSGVAPGTYEVRRQREAGEVNRLVAD